jgi:hypothetical protein
MSAPLGLGQVALEEKRVAALQMAKHVVELRGDRTVVCNQLLHLRHQVPDQLAVFLVIFNECGRRNQARMEADKECSNLPGDLRGLGAETGVEDEAVHEIDSSDE